jgi:hypothetical protein
MASARGVPTGASMLIVYPCAKCATLPYIRWGRERPISSGQSQPGRYPDAMAPFKPAECSRRHGCAARVVALISCWPLAVFR